MLEVDEAWAYVGKKDKRLKPSDPDYCGSQWVFIAMCRETKLIPAFALGKRTIETAEELMARIGLCLNGRPRIVTDALEAYKEAVERSFGSAANHAVMVPEFRDGTSFRSESTSLIERQNLTLRNFVRRLARKTLCFSKKLENLRAALSMHFCWYNFGRVHGALRCTPAMEAGLTGEIWEVERLLP